MSEMLLGKDCNTLVVTDDKVPGRFVVKHLNDRSYVKEFLNPGIGVIEKLTISDNSYMVAGLAAKQLYVWNLKENLVNSFGNSFYASYFAPDTKNFFFCPIQDLLVSDHNKRAIMGSVASFKGGDSSLSFGFTQYDEISCFGYGSKGLIGVGTTGGSVLIGQFSLVNHKTSEHVSLFKSPVKNIAFADNGRYATTCHKYTKNKADRYDIKIFFSTGEEIAEDYLSIACTALSFSPDGKHVLAGLQDGCLCCFSETGGKFTCANTMGFKHAIKQIVCSGYSIGHIITADGKLHTIDFLYGKVLQVYSNLVATSILRIVKRYTNESLIECEKCGNSFWANILSDQVLGLFSCPSCE
jgi:WD40 repeat protein